MILITGATGNIGVELVKRLSGAGQSVRAFVRSRTNAKTIHLPGIELVEGDFAEPKTFTPALENVDRLFLLIPSSAEVEQQQRNFVDAAKRSKIKHIVKLSQLGADEKAPGRFQRYHGAIEKYIVKADLPYTFLRPNLFMQGLLNFRVTISSQGVFYAPAGNANVSVVDVRDIASVAARVLKESGHEGNHHVAVRGLQEPQLHNDEEQEEALRTRGDAEVLQHVPQTYRPQGSEVISGRIVGGTVLVLGESSNG